MAVKKRPPGMQGFLKFKIKARN